MLVPEEELVELYCDDEVEGLITIPPGLVLLVEELEARVGIGPVIPFQHCTVINILERLICVPVKLKAPLDIYDDITEGSRFTVKEA